MSEVLKDVSNELADNMDTALAKTFVLQTGNALHELGIDVMYYCRPIEKEEIKDEFGIKLIYEYELRFDFVDTSKHDAMIRADAVDELTSKYFDAIEYVLHQKEIKLELNQALTIYARIMNECNMIAERMKESAKDV